MALMSDDEAFGAPAAPATAPSALMSDEEAFGAPKAPVTAATSSPGYFSRVGTDEANRIQQYKKATAGDGIAGQTGADTALSQTAAGLGMVAAPVVEGMKSAGNYAAETPEGEAAKVAGSYLNKTIGDKIRNSPIGVATKEGATEIGEAYDKYVPDMMKKRLSSGVDITGSAAALTGVGSLAESGLAGAAGNEIAAAAKPGSSFVKNIAEDIKPQPKPLTAPQQLNQDLGLNIQPGKAADIHQQVQTGVDNALNSATTDISGGKKFDPMQATVAASDRYHGLKSDIETNLRPALLSSAEGVSADASGLRDKLQKTVDFLGGTKDEDGEILEHGNAVPGTSSYAAIRPLQNILTKISKNNGEIPFTDLLDLRKNVNELYSPGFGSSGKGIIGDYASGVRELVKSTANDAMSYGNLDLADNLRQYDQRYQDIGEAYKSDTAQKFVDSDAHEAVSRMNHDGTKPGVDVQAKAEGMIDNIKKPTDLVALKNQMPADQYNAIRAEKLSQIISQEKDPNTGNYDLSKLQTILNPKNVVSLTARNQTALIQSLTEGNPQAQQVLQNVQKLSDNLVKRGLEHNPDLTEPGIVNKAGQVVGHIANAASIGSLRNVAAPLVKGAVKSMGFEGSVVTPQYQVLKNFAKDARIRGQTPIPPSVKTQPSFTGKQPTISSGMPQPIAYSTSGDADILSPEERAAQSAERLKRAKEAYENNSANNSLPDHLANTPMGIGPEREAARAKTAPHFDEMQNGWGSIENSVAEERHPEDVGEVGRAFRRSIGLDYKRGGAVNTSPTEKQKAAGNYRKEHVKIHGLDISIENPKGSVRTGTGKDGKEWKSPNMPAHYGYIKGSLGADGDHVDCFVGENTKSKRVYVIDQKHDDGKFDEHKCVLNCTDRDEAVRLYKGSFSDKKNRIMKVTRLTIPEFKAWLKKGNTKQPMKKAA